MIRGLTEKSRENIRFMEQLIEEAEEVIDAEGCYVMPGLIDLHTHTENSVFRGIVHDVPYTTWVRAVAEKSTRMDVNDWYDSAVLGGLEAISSGITPIADITATGAACPATQKLGLRSVIYREVGAMDQRRLDFAMRVAENAIAHWRAEVASARELHLPSRGVRQGERIRAQGGPAGRHAPCRQPRGVPVRQARLVAVRRAHHGHQARLR